MANFTQSSYSKQTFQDLVFEKEVISHIEFEDCIFISCKFVQCRFDQCRCMHVEFKKCDLSVADVKTSSFMDVSFEESKVIGINWQETSFATSLTTTLRFHKSVVNYSIFGKANWKGLQMIECEAHDVDFSESNLDHANFSGTDLKDATFSHTDLHGADFRKAYNYLINPTTNTIKKALFSLPNAVGLLQPFSITIYDTDGEKLTGD